VRTKIGKKGKKPKQTNFSSSDSKPKINKARGLIDVFIPKQGQVL
jgi:hypothetical protein